MLLPNTAIQYFPEDDVHIEQMPDTDDGNVCTVDQVLLSPVLYSRILVLYPHGDIVLGTVEKVNGTKLFPISIPSCL